MSACSVRGLVRVFGQRRALDGISFDIQPGEIFGLIGPNGSGKTTTLRIVATLLRPTAGSVTVLGHDVAREPEAVRRLISYLPEDAGAYRNLSGWDYLRFMATFYTRDRRERDAMVAYGQEISGLGARLADKVKTYSKGMARRLLLARALMQGLGIGLNLISYIAVGVALFLAVVCALALATLLAVFADDAKSAQVSVTPLMMLVMVPYFFSMLFDISTVSLPVRLALYALPFSYPFLTPKAVFFGNWGMVFAGYGYMVLFAAGCIALAARIFSSERILTVKLALRWRRGRAGG